MIYPRRCNGNREQDVVEESPKQRVMGWMFLLGSLNERWDGRTERAGKVGNRSITCTATSSASTMKTVLFLLSNGSVYTRRVMIK